MQGEPAIPLDHSSFYISLSNQAVHLVAAENVGDVSYAGKATSEQTLIGTTTNVVSGSAIQANKMPLPS